MGGCGCGLLQPVRQLLWSAPPAAQLWQTALTARDVHGLAAQGLRTVNTADGSRGELGVQGLFYGIGHTPNSKLVAGQVELDEAGYVKVRCALCCLTHVTHVTHVRRTL